MISARSLTWRDIPKSTIHPRLSFHNPVRNDTCVETYTTTQTNCPLEGRFPVVISPAGQLFRFSPHGDVQDGLNFKDGDRIVGVRHIGLRFDVKLRAVT